MARFLLHRRVPAFLTLAICSTLSLQPLSAQAVDTPAPTPPWSFGSIWRLPLISWLSPQVSHELLWYSPPAPPPPPCLVQPLSEVTDLEAVQFELAAGTEGVINTDGLTPAAARALVRFEQMVTSAGGRLVLTSAYRPAAYQAHLQELWDKWMFELRHNTDDACAELRAEVQLEFARHQLLETQRPVTFSDHTRGISFDAAVLLPRRARYGRRRATIDGLARIAGIRRPAIAADPVHFKVL